LGEEQFANIRDEVFDEMQADFEKIMNEVSSEEVLSDDTGCVRDMSEYEMDRVEKFVSSPEIYTLNACTKHCIHDYYTMGDILIYIPYVHYAWLV